MGKQGWCWETGSSHEQWGDCSNPPLISAESSKATRQEGGGELRNIPVERLQNKSNEDVWSRSRCLLVTHMEV